MVRRVRRAKHKSVKRKRVEWVFDLSAALRSILRSEDDFNVALDKVVELLHSRRLLDPEDSYCLSIQDILLLKQAHVRLRRAPEKVVVEVVAPIGLLRFCREGECAT
jgi:hypothetical protein